MAVSCYLHWALELGTLTNGRLSDEVIISTTNEWTKFDLNSFPWQLVNIRVNCHRGSSQMIPSRNYQRDAFSKYPILIVVGQDTGTLITSDHRRSYT